LTHIRVVAPQEYVNIYSARRLEPLFLSVIRQGFMDEFMRDLNLTTKSFRINHEAKKVPSREVSF